VEVDQPITQAILLVVVEEGVVLSS